MDRRPPGLGPENEDNPEPPRDSAAQPADLGEAEWDRILPPIDEDDPEWQAYVRKKVQESLENPSPPVPAEDAFAEVYAHIERRRAARAGGN